MLVGIVFVTVFLSSMVTGQTDNFEQECNILRTLENLELRVQKQEALMEQKTTHLLQQQTLLEAQTTQLKHLESLLSNQTAQLQQQEALLKNQTSQLQQQEALLKNQTTQLQQQETLLKQAEDRIRELESEQASLKQPDGGSPICSADVFQSLDTIHVEDENMSDCGVLYANGTTRSGVYSISPDKLSPFDVYCDMTDGGWTVIQRRIDGAVRFNRTWEEYVNGFGNVNGEYWLGLEKIHRIAKDGAEIYFDIGNYDGTRDYAHYKSFTVHDVTTLYKMNVDASGYSGSIDELFSNQNDMKFSTYDRDNDGYSSVNCAQYYGGGGWWYRSCFRLGGFNGVFGKKDKEGINYFKTGYVYVKTVTIKLKQML